MRLGTIQSTANATMSEPSTTSILIFQLFTTDKTNKQTAKPFSLSHRKSMGFLCEINQNNSQKYLHQLLKHFETKCTSVYCVLCCTTDRPIDCN